MTKEPQISKLPFIPTEVKELGFYADPENWKLRPDADSRGMHTAVELDKGARAQAALAAYQPRHLVSAVALIVDPAGRFLVGKREHQSGKGLYACPGGHLEFCETPVQAAVREAYEETYIALDPDKGVLIGVDADANPVVGPWVVIFYRFDVKSGIKARNRVPESNGAWEWCPLTKPPEPMFHNLAKMLRRYEVSERVK